MTLTVGSLFSGIGGFDAAFEAVGAEVLWQVETDPTCNRILERHWPNARRYGDVTTQGAATLAPVDLICGGFPCQDVSTAGNRAGLAGERSGLWHEFARILAELRPRYVVIENVPGLLSSNAGRDMGTILRALGDMGYGWAYRILDAQWAGLAQRRDRVFIVGCLGDPGRAAQILLEPEGGLGDSPPRREAGARLATDVAAGLGGVGGQHRGWNNTAEQGLVAGEGVARTLVGGADEPGRHGEESGGADRATLVALPLTAHHPRDGSADTNYVVARPLKGGGNDRQDESHETYVVAAIHGGFSSGTSDQHGSGITEDGPMYTLDSLDNHSIAHTVVANGDAHSGFRDERGLVTHTLTSKGAEASEDGTGRGVPMVVSESGPGWWRDGVGPLRAEGENRPSRPSTIVAPMHQQMAVRRLTPLECERLQGFPDGHTAHDAAGKAISDSARYRMLGNAVAPPVAQWIAERIVEAAEKEAKDA